MISISIVSHGHASFVEKLLSQISRLDSSSDLEVFLTLNTSERRLSLEEFSHLNLTVVQNNSVKGFGANHNSSFELSKGEWFCVMNPDITFVDDPFPGLIIEAEKTKASIVAPPVKSTAGVYEHNARSFPTPVSIFQKLLGLKPKKYSFKCNEDTQYVDWLAGMFMLFKSEDFARLGGFDEKYHLYYEDVDICARAWNQDMKVVLSPVNGVIHDAQRSSHHDPRYFFLHLKSMCFYFYKHWGRLPAIPASPQ
jgi:N-acetylglucosaminyl-diphospho-decaprenol L-rhamnosyltransferase